MIHRIAFVALVLLAGASAPAGADAKASALVKRFLAVYDQASCFEGVVRVYCRHAGKSTETTYQLYLQKPNKSGFKVLSAPHQRGSEGTKLVWLGGPQVDVRTRFFGLPVSLKADVTDPRLGDLRGDTMADLNVVTAVGWLRAPDARFRYLGREALNGRFIDRVELRSPRLLKGIRHEVFGLDAETALPLTREMHDEAGLAYKLTVERFTLDNDLPPAAFTLD